MAAEAAEMVPYIQYPERVPLRQWKELNHNREWTAIHLLQNGARVEANARHCPATMAALGRAAAAAGPRRVAQCDVLAACAAHAHSAAYRRRQHPAGLPPAADRSARLRLPGRRDAPQWRVGEAFVFDDTIEHEAWNDSDELRVVLIFDLWPPALGEAEREAVARSSRRSGWLHGGRLGGSADYGPDRSGAAVVAAM